MAELSVKLEPWSPPNFARLAVPPRPRQEGMQTETPCIAVADMDYSALNQMAGEWLNALYGKAGRPCPWRCD